MALFKKKKETRRITQDNTCSIHVLGAGCKSCRMLYENVREAVSEMHLAANVEYVTDMQWIISCGVMRLPAIAVNGKIISAGTVLKASDIIKLLRKQGL